MGGSLTTMPHPNSGSQRSPFRSPHLALWGRMGMGCTEMSNERQNDEGGQSMRETFCSKRFRRFGLLLGTSFPLTETSKNTKINSKILPHTIDKQFFLCYNRVKSTKKGISVRKRRRYKREKCLKRDHYAFCKVHVVKGKGKSRLILKLYSV